MTRVTQGSIVSLLVLLPLSSALRLPNVIANNMVLQRKDSSGSALTSARIWGWANATRVLTAIVSGEQAVSTTVSSNGTWSLDLPPMPASTDHTITITESVSMDQIVLVNISFGDVYLCSGQSNMQFSTNDAFNATLEIADSARYANLRLYTIALTAADTPQTDGKSATPYQWAIAGPAAFVPAGGAAFSYFSATCYFFGRDLYLALNEEIPIGLVASDWGGQKVEAFSSPDAMADTTCGGTVKGMSPSGAAMAARVQRAKAAEGLIYTPLELESVPIAQRPGGPVPNPSTSQLWFGQIYPFLPMRMTGATWYQGEANAGDPPSYACRFPAMIADWRKKFDLPNLSFFFVQLAGFTSNYALIREAQMAALALPNVGYAVAIDIGDPTSPEGNIHPRRKQEVGRRLSLATRKIQYKESPLVSTGPTYLNYTISVDETTKIGTIIVKFDPAVSNSLHFSGTAACVACCAISPLEVSVGGTITTGVWVRTTLPIINQAAYAISATFNVTSQLMQGGVGGVAVRYDWEGYPQCALYNGVGGPDNHTGIAATPFLIAPPSPPPPSWDVVYRQTLPFLWPAQTTLSLNAVRPQLLLYYVPRRS